MITVPRFVKSSCIHCIMSCIYTNVNISQCKNTYHVYKYIIGTLPDVSITDTTSTNTSIKVNIGTIPSSVIDRVIIGYHRLDLGVPVVGEYGNNHRRSTPKTFLSLVPGAKYKITAWGLGGGSDRRRSRSPAVREVTTMEKGKLLPQHRVYVHAGLYCTHCSSNYYINMETYSIHFMHLTDPSHPRHLTITRVCDDGIELNWIPPREPNGDIRHYIIKYTTQNGTQQEINTTNNINYYNLTGLERGQTYNNIEVVAVNSAGGGRGSQPITSYVHTPTVESTSEFKLEV